MYGYPEVKERNIVKFHVKIEGEGQVESKYFYNIQNRSGKKLKNKKSFIRVFELQIKWLNSHQYSISIHSLEMEKDRSDSVG